MRSAWSYPLKGLAFGAVALSLVLAAIGTGPMLTAGAASSSGHSAHHARHTRGHKKAKGHFVYNYARYIRGHGKANAKLSSVTVGVVNQQTSTHAPGPHWTTGAVIAEHFINQHTHGIDGHPIHLVRCKIATTVATGSKCGQEFADDKKISAVAMGPIAVGSTALQSALLPSKEPLFSGIAILPSQAAYKYGISFFGDLPSVLAEWATFAKTYFHAKSVSLVYPLNTPGQLLGANLVQGALNVAGIHTVYKVGFTAADTNLTDPFEAAHVGSTTLTILQNSGGPACSSAYLTLKSLKVHTNVAVNEPCDTITNAKADGGQLPHDWYYAGDTAMSGVIGTKAVPSFERIAAKYGHPHTDTTWVQNGFAELVTIAHIDAKLLRKHKPVTAKTVFAAAKAFKGPVAEGPRHLSCGNITKIFPALCTDVCSLFQNISPGVFKLDEFEVGPPKGFKFSTTG